MEREPRHRKKKKTTSTTTRNGQITFLASRGPSTPPQRSVQSLRSRHSISALSPAQEDNLMHEKRGVNEGSLFRKLSSQVSTSLKNLLLSLPFNPTQNHRSDKRRFLHGGIVPIDPMTPDVRQACSKRAFDGQVRKWRRMLHEWDPEGGGEEAATATTAAAAAAADAPVKAATTPGGPLVSPGSKRNAAYNTSRTPASAVHPRKQRARGGAGAKGAGEENGERAAGAGIFADAVLVSADEAAAP